MCGIAGILGSNPENQPALEHMLLAQKHRGPDALHLWKDSKMALGHNRLSIIDLSENANQPMVSNNSNDIIVFNGEIYNYVELRKELQPFYNFRTHSDTEVLLAAYSVWGKRMLDRLNGMFSFAIWDANKKVLFAARDRFGVKPFYYAFYENQFYFSSELKALFAAGIQKLKNLKVWANYFSFATYGLPHETFFENISQLPGGHSLEIHCAENLSPADLQIEKWYDFTQRIAQQPTLNALELKEQYNALLIDAIRLRFRADVPLGMNVSGGLDSSLLISLVSQNLPSTQSIEAFTFYSGHTDYDELPWVHELMQKTAFPLHEIVLDYKQIPALIAKVSHFQDEPYGGFPTLAYSLLFASAHQKGIRVLLDGQGMDEAWAGYDYYHNNTHQVIQGLQSSPVRPEVFDATFLSHAQKEIYEQPFDNALQNLQYRDLFYTKIPRALRFNDRISMMHGTELREPFLDYRLVELAFAQPREMKIKNGQTKWLLRDLAQEQLGDSIALAPKRALQTPQREWIANELADYFERQLTAFAQLDFVDKNKVERIWQAYKNGNQDNSFYIWQWINSVVL